MVERRILLLLMCTAVLSVSPVARADRGTPRDRARATLARMDQDKDGRVSLIEYATEKLRELNGGKGGSYRLGPKSDAYLRSLDENKDGEISPAELARGNVGNEFRAIDTNRDGYLVAEELEAAFAKVERAEREKLLGFIERYDVNHDGKVTREEWPGSAAVFDRLDLNRDGVISAADAPR